MTDLLTETHATTRLATVEQPEYDVGRFVDLSALPGYRLPMAGGYAVLDHATGQPMAFVDETNLNRHVLLDDTVAWHSADYCWGSGYVTTEGGSSQWNVPMCREVRSHAVVADYALQGSGLALTVTRTGGNCLTERYEWRNVTARPVVITGLGISTPFNDRYPGAARALDECVNAHVFAGGAWAWVLAKPMDGLGNRLGLIVRDGTINAYAVDTRNHVTYSNVRGHIMLEVTDRALNPGAFGGQQAITLSPGEVYTLVWEIGWYASDEEFLAATKAPAKFSALRIELGSRIEVSTTLPVTALDEGLTVSHTSSGALLTSDVPGVHQVAIGEGKQRSHTEVLFHKSLRQTVNDRVRYILNHQVAYERDGKLAGAMVATDIRTGRHVIDPSWNDWSDGSERIAMPVLVQRSLNMGFLDADLSVPAQRAADAWRDFAEAELIDSTGSCRRGSGQQPSEFGGRLYDVSWFVDFYTEHYRASADRHDLDMAVKMMDRAAYLGGEKFLCIEFAENTAAVSKLLEESGRFADAERIRSRVIASADYFLEVGRALPYHEVSYEQSMAAPLVSLLLQAYYFTGRREYLDGAKERLRWLLSFGGPQPDCRLRDIGIRHWDGYWFGINRQFGDVFPHYWSVLTAEVLARLPQSERTEETRRTALGIFKANLANVNADGSATCAYLFPSHVDGRAMSQADPLANDQDWALNIWMRMIREEGFPEA